MPSPDSSRGLVAAHQVLVVVALAERLGLPREALLQEIGLCPDDIAGPDSWIPQRAWREVWTRGVAHCGDEAVGLRAAAAVDPASAMSCSGCPRRPTRHSWGSSPDTKLDSLNIS